LVLFESLQLLENVELCFVGFFEEHCVCGESQVQDKQNCYESF